MLYVTTKNINYEIFLDYWLPFIIKYADFEYRDNGVSNNRDIKF